MKLKSVTDFFKDIKKLHKKYFYEHFDQIVDVSGKRYYKGRLSGKLIPFDCISFIEQDPEKIFKKGEK